MDALTTPITFMSTLIDGVQMKAMFLGFTFLLAAFAADAKPAGHNQEVEPIILQQKEIRADVLAERNGWDAIPVEKRSEMIAKQDLLFSLLAGKKVIGDLAEKDQIEVVNSLEWIKALVDNAEDERLVCKRERSTGSNKPVRVCRTVAQIRKDREAAKQALLRHGVTDQTPQPTRPGGG